MWSIIFHKNRLDRLIFCDSRSIINFREGIFSVDMKENLKAEITGYQVKEPSGWVIHTSVGLVGIAR
jgi:hypothetical protein